MRDRLVTRTVLACIFSFCTGGVLLAADTPPNPEDDTPIPETTPPRLALIDGTASFWRPGAEDWSPAQVNIAMAAGDRLYTDTGSNLELQLDARVFVRTGEKTQIGIANIEPDFVQFEVTTGQASIDVREIDAGHTIAVATPNAAFTIEQAGYYRVNVNGDTSTFITRRGGRAIVTPEGGRAGSVSPSEQVVVQGQGSPTVETYVAPDLDDWDRWNYARTDRLLDSMSARYVSPGVAGTADLDYNGSWRVVPTYGPVWIPRGVASGWAPYTTGRWVLDPYYGWTWVDYAPWGWAPYHYGRWVYLDSYWAWAPGPLVVRTAYAPALVAFFGGDDWSIGLNLGGPAIGWFALGWGEPCYPWWGPSYWRYSPWWGGWGGHHHHWDDDHDHGHDHGHDGDHDDHWNDNDDHDHHHVHDYQNARVPRAVSARAQRRVRPLWRERWRRASSHRAIRRQRRRADSRCAARARDVGEPDSGSRGQQRSAPAGGNGESSRHCDTRPARSVARFARSRRSAFVDTRDFTDARSSGAADRRRYEQQPTSVPPAFRKRRQRAARAARPPALPRQRRQQRHEQTYADSRATAGRSTGAERTSVVTDDLAAAPAIAALRTIIGAATIVERGDSEPATPKRAAFGEPCAVGTQRSVLRLDVASEPRPQQQQRWWRRRRLLVARRLERPRDADAQRLATSERIVAGRAGEPSVRRLGKEIARGSFAAPRACANDSSWRGVSLRLGGRASADVR